MKSLDSYVNSYLDDYEFESVMVRYRRQLIVERLKYYAPKVVIEIGCGAELQYEEWLRLGGPELECWITVEPADHFFHLAQRKMLPNFHVIKSLFENAASLLLSKLPRPPDLVLASGLLHEVRSPHGLLFSIREVMGRQTKLHVNVPNSESLHRRLARSMGLISDTKSMSERNVRLFQDRVYDRSSLNLELSSAGLRVCQEGGIFIKPFTHSQMEIITPELGLPVLDGLFSLGKELPDIASEIWAEAVLNERE